MEEIILLNQKKEEIDATLHDIFDRSLENEDIEILDYYLKNNLVYKSGSYKSELIEYALLHGKIKLIEFFIKDLRNFREYGDRMLYYCAELGHLEILKLIIKKINVNVNNGQALYSAINNGDIEMVKLLIEHGAKINRNFSSAIRTAIAGDHLDIIKLLIENEVDIHTHSNVILTISLTYSKKEVIIYLLFLYSTEQLKKILSKDKKLFHYLLKYIIKENLVNHRIVEIYRELGTDVFDLIEKEN